MGVKSHSVLFCSSLYSFIYKPIISHDEEKNTLRERQSHRVLPLFVHGTSSSMNNGDGLNEKFMMGWAMGLGR